MRQQRTTSKGSIRRRLHMHPHGNSRSTQPSQILSHSMYHFRPCLVAIPRQRSRLVPKDMPSVSNPIGRQGRHTTCCSHTRASLPQSPHRHDAHAQVPRILIYCTSPLLAICMARISLAMHRNRSHPWCLHIQRNIMPMGRT